MAGRHLTFPYLPSNLWANFKHKYTKAVARSLKSEPFGSCLLLCWNSGKCHTLCFLRSVELHIRNGQQLKPHASSTLSHYSNFVFECLSLPNASKYSTENFIYMLLKRTGFFCWTTEPKTLFPQIYYSQLDWTFIQGRPLLRLFIQNRQTSWVWVLRRQLSLSWWWRFTSTDSALLLSFWRPRFRRTALAANGYSSSLKTWRGQGSRECLCA